MPARTLPTVTGLSPYSQFDAITTTGNVVAGGALVGNGSGITFLSPTISGLPAYAVPWVYANAVGFANLHATANVTVLGNMAATAYSGNGSALTGLVASQISGLPAYSVPWVYANAAGAANLATTANVTVLGNLTATHFYGDGSFLSGISAGGGGSQWSYGNTAGQGANVYVTAQVAVLGNLCVSGNIVSTALSTTKLQVVGTVTATSFVGSGASLTGVPASLTATYVTFGAPAFVAGTGTAMTSASLTAGTWVLTGAVGITTTNSGVGLYIDFSTASGAIASPQPGYTTVLTSVTGLQYLSTTAIINLGSTTTYYLNAQYNGTASSWSASNNTTAYFRYILLA